MKSVVLGILRYKYTFLFLLLCFYSVSAPGQTKKEREFKISRAKIPKSAQNLIAPYLEDAKRIRCYREIDGDKRSYEVKFKKRRLFYSVEFDDSGVLEDVEFNIKTADIPDESWKNILQYFQDNFQKFSIKKIQQQYPVTEIGEKKTMMDAFQNLILPYINYELVFSAKKEKGFEYYEVLFDSKGRFLTLRKSLPAKYDHVLY